MPQAGSLVRPIREEGNEDTKPRFRVLEGEAAISRQLAAQVNNRRTPSGNFYTIINPTIFEKEPPPATYEGHNTTQLAVTTMRGSGRLGTPGGIAGDSQTAAQQPSATGAVAGVTTTLPPIAGGSGGDVGGKNASWLLPWQTGDRELGRTMAENIRHKRTPIGAFAVRDLAKKNK